MPSIALVPFVLPGHFWPKASFGRDSTRPHWMWCCVRHQDVGVLKDSNVDPLGVVGYTVLGVLNQMGSGEFESRGEF